MGTSLHGELAKSRAGEQLPPSLFCFALIMPHGYEQQHIARHATHGVGIFDCEESAVFSNVSFKIRSNGVHSMSIETVAIGGSLDTVIMTGNNGVIAANKDIFVRVWAAVVQDLRPWGHDWTVKADADAVFIPERLRGLLRMMWPPEGRADGYSAFLKNCKYTLYGAIEVLSHRALAAYNDSSVTSCKVGTAGQAVVEDRYLNECLKVLGARP